MKVHFKYKGEDTFIEVEAFEIVCVIVILSTLYYWLFVHV
jgi:hypothetical protein